MQIGGLQKLSLIDYPGKVAAVIFTQGCNFRCPFCHNRHLVLSEYFQPPLSVKDILGFLQERQGKLQGVVISGGEPTIQTALFPFLDEIKSLGYPVKLDTNGSRPQVIDRLLQRKLIDFVAMDVKGPWERYRELSGVDVDTQAVRASVRLILDSGIGHVFRTTVVKPFLSSTDIQQTAAQVAGAQVYRLQEFTPGGTVLDQRLMDVGHYTAQEFSDLQAAFEWDTVAV